MNTPSDPTPPSSDPEDAPAAGPEATPADEPEAATAQAPEMEPEDRNIASLVHLSGLLFSVIVPLVLWLLHKDTEEKRALTAQCKEALNFQIMVLIGYVISAVLTTIVIGVFLFWLVWIANLVFCIMAAIKVSQTGRYDYPLTVRLVN